MAEYTLLALWLITLSAWGLIGFAIGGMVIHVKRGDRLLTVLDGLFTVVLSGVNLIATWGLLHL